jgi:hypothetical protein
MGDSNWQFDGLCFPHSLRHKKFDRIQKANLADGDFNCDFSGADSADPNLIVPVGYGRLRGWR